MTDVQPGQHARQCARYCAFDLDECTVTVAFDSEHEVQDFLDEIPPGRRAHVCAEPPEDEPRRVETVE
jgi:hypothetical protein